MAIPLKLYVTGASLPGVAPAVVTTATTAAVVASAAAAAAAVGIELCEVGVADATSR